MTPVPVFVAFAAFMLILYGHHFGLRVPPWPGFEGLFRPRKSAGQKSGVRTDTLEMVLDHDSGQHGGTVSQGPVRRQGPLPRCGMHERPQAAR